MALKTESERFIYVSNFMGKFEVRVKTGTPGSVVRTKKNGEEISVLNYKSLDGKIVDIKKDVGTKEYNGVKMVSMKIFIDDWEPDGNGEAKEVHYVLSFPYDSSLTSAFYHMVENIDFGKEVEISSSHGKDKVTDKEKTSLFIKQNGENLKWRYTKKWAEENPTAPKKPEWEKKLFKGKEVWDNYQETLFFEAIMKEKILPGLRAAKAASPIGPASYVPPVMDDDDFPEGPVSEEAPAPVDDDMPF